MDYPIVKKAGEQKDLETKVARPDLTYANPEAAFTFDSFLLVETSGDLLTHALPIAQGFVRRMNVCEQGRSV